VDVPALEEAGVEGGIEVVEFPGRIDSGRNRDLIPGEKVRAWGGIGSPWDREAQVAANLALRAARTDARHLEDVDVPVELARGGAGECSADIGVLVELQAVEGVGFISPVPGDGEGGPKERCRGQKEGEGCPVPLQKVEDPGPEQEDGKARKRGRGREDGRGRG
jgi:hypothetical protein